MSDVSRETGGFSLMRIEAACRYARKVDPRRFALMWMDGVKGAAIGATFGISDNYVTELRRRYGLPARKGGRPRKLVRQTSGIVTANPGQGRRDA